MARERFQDNLRLVLGVTGGLLVLFLLAELLLRKSRDFQPDFLASALLYGLTVLNFSLLLVLVFVLGRNLVRMLMEWRRGVFGARLRVQLLLVFLLMAIAPSLLILLVGSDLLRQTVDRWFNVDAFERTAALQLVSNVRTTPARLEERGRLAQRRTGGTRQCVAGCGAEDVAPELMEAGVVAADHPSDPPLAAEVRADAPPHLDDDMHGPVAGDEVRFDTAEAHVAFEHTESGEREIGRGEILGRAAAILGQRHERLLVDRGRGIGALRC